MLTDDSHGVLRIARYTHLITLTMERCMKPWTIQTAGLLLSVAVISIAGCTFLGKPVGQDKAEANTLEQEIADYRSWKKPEFYEEGFFESEHPLPEYVKYYINDIAHDSFEKPADGAVFVKEQFNKDKELIGLTVMKKIEGYDPENNDWYWAIADKSARVTNAGRLNSTWTSNCIDCHRRGDGGGDLLFVND